MANRFPLIVDSSTQQIKELEESDNIDLTNSGIVNVVSIGATNINASGIITATSFTSSGDINANGNIIGDTSTNISGINSVTAATYYGDGSNLDGISGGLTISDDTSTNSTFYPTFTSATSGTITSENISSTKLTFNPSTGTLATTNINSTSDINLKKDIEIIIDARQILDQIDGVRFRWKENNTKSIGVIAQKVEKALPELISETSDTGVKSVNYNGLVGVLIEAVKELSKEVEILKMKIYK